MDVKPEL